MEKSAIRKQIKELFPVFSQTELIDEIVEKGQYMSLPSKTPILSAGSVIQAIPIVFSGSLKVVREEQSGQSVFLYYIREGESCALTLSSCLKRETSSAIAYTESETQLVALPVESVYNFVRRYPSWNDFVIQTFNSRFEELLQLVDNVCFQKIDSRLIKYLNTSCTLLKTKELTISHQEIANDLATSREVISRLLKQLEKKGGVKLSRGKLTVLDLNLE